MTDKTSPSIQTDDPRDVEWAREFIGRIEGIAEEWQGGGPFPGLSVSYEALRRKLREVRMGQERPDPSYWAYREEEFSDLKEVASLAHEAWTCEPDGKATRAIMRRLEHIIRLGNLDGLAPPVQSTEHETNNASLRETTKGFIERWNLHMDQPGQDLELENALTALLEQRSSRAGCDEAKLVLLRCAARAVINGRIPAVSAELQGSNWKHSRIADSLLDKLRDAINVEQPQIGPPMTAVNGENELIIPVPPLSDEKITTGQRQEVIEQLCKMMGRAYRCIDPYAHEPCDCVCCDKDVPYQNAGHALTFMEECISEGIARRERASNPKVPMMTKQWRNGMEEAVRRLSQMLEDSTGRFDMDARSRAALAFILTTPQPKQPSPKVGEEIISWLLGLEGSLDRIVRSEVPASAIEKREMMARRGIYEGIADDIKRKWPILFEDQPRPAFAGGAVLFPGPNSDKKEE